MYSYGPPHMAEQKQDDQLEHTYSSYVRIWDVALKTYQRRWTIGRSSERGSGISVLAARHDDDDYTLRMSIDLMKENGLTFALYLFIICLYYTLRTSIDLMRENGLILKKSWNTLHQAISLTNGDYDQGLLINTFTQAES